MVARVHFVKEQGTFHMIHCQTRGYAVVEIRDGFLYSTDPHHKRRAVDEGGGLEEVATKTDWTSESDARRQFNDLVGTGRHLARKIW